MKKISLLFILVMLSISFAQALEIGPNHWVDFTGKLGNSDVQLSIYRFSNGTLKGNYCYKKFEKKIPLTGKINGDVIELTEMVNGRANGIFTGKVFTDDKDRFEGVWTNSDKTKSYDLKLTLCSIVSGSENHRYGSFATDSEVENFMKKAKDAILENDRQWLISRIKYPINVTLNHKRIAIKSQKQMSVNFSQIFHAEFKRKIKDACTCNMFTNYRGTMLGAGEIWIEGFKVKSKDQLLIKALNN
ncbi:hypothetical protein HQN86_19275 [Pedobacter panaciterrae]|jgi:hypothetical protein|uniref:hypothetical protein n=1 Tax=Pedobacter panaciterrae TaxID=363849 RepID=UPI00155D9147|nr:hypothetical protein [Pedobacter panaciterrae]NQX55772.1 hypothetical protein [Pedobacter panaciterrae]